MTIKAVVLDIGSVLEVVDDGLFPEPFERRHGLVPGAVLASSRLFPGDPGIGEMTWDEVRRHWQVHLDLTEAQTDELAADYWTWYRGKLDEPLYGWFAAKRGPFKTGIVSNSGPGAREAERRFRFEASERCRAPSGVLKRGG